MGCGVIDSNSVVWHVKLHGMCEVSRSAISLFKLKRINRCNFFSNLTYNKPLQISQSGELAIELSSVVHHTWFRSIRGLPFLSLRIFNHCFSVSYYRICV